jgi:tetratricopeptide (TPR) repeat protein
MRLAEGKSNEEAAAALPREVYGNALRKYGIPMDKTKPSATAARIRESSIRPTLVAFLHDWMQRVKSDAERGWLRLLLDLADDDDWRFAFREALVEKDAKKLSALAEAPEALAQPPVVASALAGAMLGTVYKYESQAFMREAQRRFPGDFWINYFLGCFWSEEYPQEAVGYFRAAVAIRPTSEGAYLMLGRALKKSGDDDGAVAAFRQSVALNPSFGVAQDLAWALAPRGELEEARAAWGRALERDSPNHDDWYGYAQLCIFLGNNDAYRRARSALLKRFGDAPQNWVVGERTSVACLLLGDPPEELRGAVRLAELTVTLGEKAGDGGSPYLQFVKGLALFRDGRPEAAIPPLREAASNSHDRAGPGLVLAMAQYQSGSKVDARKSLATAVSTYDWKEPRLPPNADQSTLWVSHVLRREAEAMMLPSLQAFLKGEYQPQDNDERLALLGICLARGRSRTAAQLLADAFLADPGLNDRLMKVCLQRAMEGYWSHDPETAFNTACRYLAARCAAVAGCGLDKETGNVSEAERAQWRKQAQDWLRADLRMWTAKLNGDSQMERDLANKVLKTWQTEPDLAGLREPDALDQLSDDERKGYLEMWRDIRALLTRPGQNRMIAAAEHERMDSPGPAPSVLIRLGRLNEARLAWKSALKADPTDHWDWHGYAELSLFLGEIDDYRRARRDLVERFGTTTDPYVAERAGRACLLMPATGDELLRFVALAQRAVARNPREVSAEPYFEFTRGLSEYRQGKFDRAISAMRGGASTVLGPAPAILTAMALHQKGRVDDARKNFASAILSYDWRANQIRDIHALVLHSIRREAETLILPDLSRFLDGKYRPTHNDERLALLGVCQFTNRTCAAARLYKEAFSGDRRLAEDLQAGHRSNAARAAALAGSGIGADATNLSETERTGWRRQAGDWLKADLALCSKMLDTDIGANRALVRKVLGDWKFESDLAGLRESEAIGSLSADERNECSALWQAVENVLRRTRDAK